jgi:hypothetical protein
MANTTGNEPPPEREQHGDDLRLQEALSALRPYLERITQKFSDDKKRVEDLAGHLGRIVGSGRQASDNMAFVRLCAGIIIIVGILGVLIATVIWHAPELSSVQTACINILSGVLGYLIGSRSGHN